MQIFMHLKTRNVLDFQVHFLSGDEKYYLFVKDLRFETVKKIQGNYLL